MSKYNAVLAWFFVAIYTFSNYSLAGQSIGAVGKIMIIIFTIFAFSQMYKWLKLKSTKA